MPQDPKLNLNIKRPLISLLKDIEEIKTFIERNGDHCGDMFEKENPSLVVKFILKLEDKSYFTHRGLDIKFLPRLIKRFIRTRKIGGISTIEQQLVRQVTNRRKRTVSRKFREIILAILINFHFSKRQILSSYLNTAYFGHGIWGLDAASSILFQKYPYNLSKEEAAFIASLLPNPIPKSVLDNIIALNSPNDPFEIIDGSTPFAPWWSKRMKLRIKAAIK